LYLKFKIGDNLLKVPFFQSKVVCLKALIISLSLFSFSSTKFSVFFSELENKFVKKSSNFHFDSEFFELSSISSKI